MISYWKDWAIIIAGVVALITFVFGVLEYIRQGHQQRAQNFVQMRRRFLETTQYREILDMLAAEDPRLREVSVQEKRNFAGFLEEVALMVESKLIRKEVAHYMFGYYVLLTSRSDHFWDNLDRTGPYWRVFNDFAKQMETLNSEPPSRDKLSF